MPLSSTWKDAFLGTKSRLNADESAKTGAKRLQKHREISAVDVQVRSDKLLTNIQLRMRNVACHGDGPQSFPPETCHVRTKFLNARLEFHVLRTCLSKRGLFYRFLFLWGASVEAWCLALECNNFLVLLLPGPSAFGRIDIEHFTLYMFENWRCFLKNKSLRIRRWLICCRLLFIASRRTLYSDGLGYMLWHFCSVDSEMGREINLVR